MDPLITNGVDPALLRVLERRGQEHDSTPRRKRPAVPAEAVEAENTKESNDPDTGLEAPKHILDDLA
ncbi:MAG: hypothetical protein WB566_12080 [Terriglobales bacterium]